jgi:hypothetical protein
VIALTVSGKDASDSLRAMREFPGKPGLKVVGWTWDETYQWLKTTRLAPDQIAAIEKIVSELKGDGGTGSKK